MNGLHRTIRVALMLGSLLAGGRVLAAEGEREVAAQINKANGLLRSGDVEGAVKAYHQVQDGAPDRADLSYNMAVAQYRKGDMAAAEQLFNQAATAEDDALAAKARYNLGNCNYAAALRSAETDHPAAIKSLEKAIEHYRRALEVDSNDADSRANIELASAMIDKLREQDKKEQQQKQQQQKQKQDQKQQDQKQQQNKDKQDQKQENSKDQEKQEKQEKKDSEQQQSKDQQQSQQNQQQKPDSSQEKKSQDQQGAQGQQQDKKDEKSKDKSGDKSDSKSKEDRSKSDESKSEQKDSKSQPQEQSKASSAEQKEKSKPENQSQSAPDKPQDKSAADKPAGQSQGMSKQNSKDKRPEQADAKQAEEAKDQKGSAAPKGALSAADQKAGKADPQGKELAGKPEVVKEGEMTVQEAEKMLQAIRDQEMIRRLKRQATERNQHVPVDHDW